MSRNRVGVVNSRNRERNRPFVRLSPAGSCNRGNTPRARASAHASAHASENEHSYDPRQLTLALCNSGSVLCTTCTTAWRPQSFAESYGRRAGTATPRDPAWSSRSCPAAMWRCAIRVTPTSGARLYACGDRGAAARRQGRRVRPPHSGGLSAFCGTFRSVIPRRRGATTPDHGLSGRASGGPPVRASGGVGQPEERPDDLSARRRSGSGTLRRQYG